MTQDEIIEMAIQAELNLYVHDLTEKRYIEVIETFAKLVAAKAAAKEREACAKVCEQIDIAAFGGERPAPNDCAAAIRARGEA